MSKRGFLTVVILIALCVALALIALSLNKGSEFGGADDAAEEVVKETNPDYQPWATSLMTPPGGETECLLFCLQSAIGAIVIGFGFGYLFARKRFSAQA